MAAPFVIWKRMMAPRIPRLYEAQEGKCFYCEAPMQNKPAHHVIKNRLDGYTVDHFVPASANVHARFSTYNTVLACMPCNHRKENRRPTEAERDRYASLMLRMRAIKRKKKKQRHRANAIARVSTVMQGDE